MIRTMNTNLWKRDLNCKSLCCGLCLHVLLAFTVWATGLIGSWCHGLYLAKRFSPLHLVVANHQAELALELRRSLAWIFFNLSQAKIGSYHRFLYVFVVEEFWKILILCFFSEYSRDMSFDNHSYYQTALQLEDNDRNPNPESSHLKWFIGKISVDIKHIP